MDAAIILEKMEINDETVILFMSQSAVCLVKYRIDRVCRISLIRTNPSITDRIKCTNRPF